MFLLEARRRLVKRKCRSKQGTRDVYCRNQLFLLYCGLQGVHKKRQSLGKRTLCINDNEGSFFTLCIYKYTYLTNVLNSKKKYFKKQNVLNGKCLALARQIRLQNFARSKNKILHCVQRECSLHKHGLAPFRYIYIYIHI